MHGSPPPVKSPAPSPISLMGFALRMASDLGVTIAAPAVLAAYVGTWLDARWGTRPWMLGLCLALAAVLTAVWIVKKAAYYKREYERRTSV